MYLKTTIGGINASTFRKCKLKAGCKLWCESSWNDEKQTEGWELGSEYRMKIQHQDICFTTHNTRLPEKTPECCN